MGKGRKSMRNRCVDSVRIMNSTHKCHNYCLVKVLGSTLSTFFNNRTPFIYDKKYQVCYNMKKLLERNFGFTYLSILEKYFNERSSISNLFNSEEEINKSKKRKNCTDISLENFHKYRIYHCKEFKALDNREKLRKSQEVDVNIISICSNSKEINFIGNYVLVADCRYFIDFLVK